MTSGCSNSGPVATYSATQNQAPLELSPSCNTLNQNKNIEIRPVTMVGQLTAAQPTSVTFTGSSRIKPYHHSKKRVLMNPELICCAPCNVPFSDETNIKDPKENSDSHHTASNNTIKPLRKMNRVGRTNGNASSHLYSSIATCASLEVGATANHCNDEPVRSTLFVQGICCASEVPTVKSILRPFSTRVEISIATKRVYVHHYHGSTSAHDLCQRLTEAGFPATIVQDGGSTILQANTSTADLLAKQKQQQSDYVESTVQFAITLTEWSRLDNYNNNMAVDSNFINGIRAIHPNARSQTIKIDHDPKIIDLETALQWIVSTYELSNSGIVLTDGAAEGLYLPKEQQISNNFDCATIEQQSSTQGDLDIDQQQKKGGIWYTFRESFDATTQMQLHVILSGIFWAISMIGALGQPNSIQSHLQYAGLLSVATGLPPVAVKAYRTARRCQFDANCMMVVAAFGALLLGEFDEAASVSFLFAVSEYLEARASQRARRALESIVQLRPDHAHWMPDKNDDPTHVLVVPAEQVAIDSWIRVRTGDKIAADGIVVEGQSLVDQSSLTGESVPVQVSPGSIVAGGSINIGQSPLIVQTSATVQDSAVSRLIRLVEEAQVNRSDTEKMVDRFARAYTPSVVVVAFILATFPWLWGTDMGRYWTLNALILVVIACPCALTISTPVTYAAGLAAVAQRGIVCKGGASLEALGSVKTVIFDKTGTITKGRFDVAAIELIGQAYTHGQMLALLAAIEGPSSHPLSATLVDAAHREGVANTHIDVKDHAILKGEGVSAKVEGKVVYVGNERLFVRIGMYEELPDKYKQLAIEWDTQLGGTVGFIGVEGVGIIGSYCVTDVIRPEAKEAIKTLQLDGITVIMLTGDGDGAAQAVARQVGLFESAVHSQLLPEDKLHFVGSLKYPSSSTGSCFGLFRQQPRVLFCGDGVNDAPALSIADVGISMGEGAALAMEMSDVTLMDSNLSKIVYVMDMGQRVLYTIRENILLSLFCKVAVVVLTFNGYMTLLYAIASDVGVMLLVTLNGMKLLPRRGERSGQQSCFSALRVYSALNSDSERRVDGSEPTVEMV